MELQINFQQAEFVKSATKPIHYPPETMPEVAVMGRSNVGKSSLMNSLFHRRSLVKVSRTPGRTQLINFFSVDGKMMIVDLPGYGFAKVPESIRRRWRPMIESYLTTRRALLGSLLLLDIRRIPNEDDLDLWNWLHHFDQTVVPVITKADKLSKQKANNQIQRIANVLQVPVEAIVATSSKTHKGREQLRRILTGLCWQFDAEAILTENPEKNPEETETSTNETESPPKT